MGFPVLRPLRICRDKFRPDWLSPYDLLLFDRSTSVRKSSGRFAQGQVARRLADRDDREHRRSVRFLQTGSTDRSGDRLRFGWSAADRRNSCEIWAEARERKIAKLRSGLTDFLTRAVDAQGGPLANPGQDIAAVEPFLRAGPPPAAG